MSVQQSDISMETGEIVFQKDQDSIDRYWREACEEAERIARTIEYEYQRGLAEKDVAIAEKDLVIAKYDLAIAEKNLTIAEKDLTIAEIKVALAKKDLTIAEETLLLRKKTLSQL